MKNFSKTLWLSAILLFILANVGWGQILTFEFSALAGNETSANSNFNNSDLNSSTISRGAGLTASANGGRFNATSWALTSIANAISGNDYMEFTITPNSGYQFSVSSIVIQFQRSSTGPSALALRSSLDGYTTNLDAIKTIIDNTSTQTFTFTFSQSNSTSAVTYRLYSYAESTLGSGGPGDGSGNDIVINGTVTSTGGVNPPTSFAISHTTDNRIRLTWTAPSGSYDNVLIFGRAGGDITHTPSGEGSGYNDANADWGSAGIYSTDNKLLYSGTGTSVEITGLSNSTTYYFKAYAYSGSTWSSGTASVNDEAEVQGVTGFTSSSGNALSILSWTNPSYFTTQSNWWDEVLILVKSGSTVDGTPSGDGTGYTANSVFGSGTEIGTGNFVVYKGTGTTETVTSLSNGTTYYFRTFVRHGTVWTDADQYQDTNATPLNIPELIISEVADPSDIYNARFVEIYNASGSSIDFSSTTFYLSRQANGSTWNDVQLTGTLAAGVTYIVAYQTLTFNTTYGFDPDLASGYISGNGDDAYFIYYGGDHSSGTLVDIYGVIDEDGTGKPWEYEDSHAVRNAGVTQPNTTWTSSEWEISSATAAQCTPGQTPLPVELCSFASSITANSVNLNWSTAVELNNSGFDIERKKTESIDWQKIGFVQGHGTTNTPQSYSYSDRYLSTGKYNYRLKQIDFNGNYQYYYLGSEVSIGVPKKFELSQNFPNPFNPVTKLSYELPSDSKVSIKVFDMLGREVSTLLDELKTAGYHTVDFNGSGLSSGMYFYRIKTNEFEAIKKMLLLK